MKLRAYGKINETLHITGKLDNGYHTLISRMRKISLFDEVDMEKISSGFSFSCSDKGLENSGNHGVKAHGLMEKLCGHPLPVKISIKKNIPVAAGLAGGTADGAAVIHGLNALFDLGFSPDFLAGEALSLGADYPFCLGEEDALAQGVGEILQSIPVEKKLLLLVNPGFPVSTPEAYKLYDEHPVNDPVNDLMPGVMKKYPVIKHIVEKLKESGAEFAAMTGSGPTVFGVFSSPSEREFGAKRVQTLGKVYFCETGRRPL